jgi:hypothetical protein
LISADVLRSRRVAGIYALGASAFLAACGLNSDGTAPGRIGAGGGYDATASGGESGVDDPGDHQGPDDARLSEASSGDGTLVDGSPSGDETVDGSPAPDSAAGDASNLDSSDASSDATVLPDADAGIVSDAGNSDSGPVDAGGPSDAGVDRREGSAPDASASGDASVDGGACDFNGTWASRLTIDVTWAPQGLNGIILASGSGQIKQWIKGVRVQTGTATSDATVVCGIDLPDFQETAIAGGETYGVKFPASLFDNGYLPTFTVSAALSGFTVGSTYSTTTTAALLGLTMTNPTTDPWPSTVSTEVDMDHDNEPGVTIGTAQGSGYSDVPTAIPGFFQQPARANRLYVAIRQVTIVTGTVVGDCNHMSGTIAIPQIQSKYAIDSHVMGCALVDGGDCTTSPPPTGTSQAAFVDNTQPVFTPSGSTDFHSVRLATGASCADVRAALP